jgi:hypothetical protein
MPTVEGTDPDPDSGSGKEIRMNRFANLADRTPKDEAQATAPASASPIV